MQCHYKLKVIASLFLIAFVSIIFAQETHNLEIIWQKASPETIFAFGRCIASGDVNGDNFSDIMIVGDSAIDAGPVIDTFRGRCWIFYGGQDFDTVPDVCLNNLQKLTFWSLHSADINGDGYDDVILGACNNEPSGQVLVFLGGNPMDTICDYRIRGPSLSSVFGCSISSGDVNGDSYDDLIIGAYYAFLRPGFFPGRVYIYFGGPNFDTIPDVVLNGGHNNDQEEFGVSVSGKGDVNNDGFSDIIIGARTFGSGIEGRIYIYYGGDPIDTIYDVAMTGEGASQTLGEFGVDFIRNNQTYDYAITSTPLWGPTNPQGYNPGKVYVLFGGNPMDSIPDVWMIGRTDASRLGMSLSSAGDVNGDSCDEIISGAPIEYDFRGTAYIWLGGSLLDTIPDAWIRGTQQNDGIGWHVASAGDVNRDSRDEIMVSNSASNFSPKRVWVCKYTGPGIEERQVQNAKRLTLEINPNPAKTYLTVRLSPTADRQELKVFDVSGKMIREIATSLRFASQSIGTRSALRNDRLGETKISLKGINPGIYFLKIGKETKKFLVVR